MTPVTSIAKPPPYVELHTRSAFSFLRGASFPEHIAEVAAERGLPAIALTDRNGVYGAPRFYAKAKESGVRPIVGAELTMDDGSVLPVLVESRLGYQNLCRLVTNGHLRAPKGECALRWDELPEFAEGLIALTGDDEGPLFRAIHAQETRNTAALSPQQILERLTRTFGADRVYVELQRHHLRGEEVFIRAQRELAAQHKLPLLATGGVLYAKRNGRPVLDVFTCLRNHTHLDAAGKLLARNSERYLKPAAEMHALFRDLPEALENTVRLADRLQFSLENLGYEFPRYPLAEGQTPEQVLWEQTYAGAHNRYGAVLSPEVKHQLERELNLIAKLGFCGYFLIVADIVKFCRESNIMCQGRGSAANSAVCYSLGITACDPIGGKLLFERFLSEGRKSWPDIDIDLPSGDRRERVIQEVYQRYGKHGAAMTANVITYRGRSAAREIGKTLNFQNDILDRFSALFASGDFPHTMDLRAQIREAGLPENHARLPAFVSLYRSIYGLPRHLGQHSGGMIISQGKLSSVVPLENASMPGRVVAQWDKDDCEDLGIIKVDLLGLGMMSVLQDSIELTRERGRPVDIAKIPHDDEKTYELMQTAETIGVFQIESRAQMATLPRMKPKNFYDVVIEVAIIRPGPIQGHLMHPYLARRAGKEPVTYYHDDLIPVLERTLGVPLFQEQMLKIAMVMADFTGSEAEELRRALSFHRSQERMQKVEIKLRAALERKKVEPKTIEEIIKAIGSFALYGFPESHAISFALLAYASAYLKVHYAPEFYSSLLNNQPMGFYSPATIIKDGNRRGVRFRPVCAMRSDYKCIIEPDDSIRLGFCVVQGLHAESAQKLITERERLPFISLSNLKSRVPLNKSELRRLAEIGALNCFADHRRDAMWDAERDLPPESDLFNFTDRPQEKEKSPLAPMNPAERLRSDYEGMRLTTGPHPMALLRPQIPNIWRAIDIPRGREGQIITIAGNVICRQRPGTAKGFVFISLEDETGISNAIVKPQLFEDLRLVITQENFLQITGKLQTRENVFVIQAHTIERLEAHNLSGTDSYDFH
ncbi:MAG TPA: error-prone DNA polymerase [Verrucomicrobiae bacterium]